MTDPPSDKSTSRARALGRRLHWIPVEQISRVMRAAWLVVVGGFVLLVLLYALWALNWAPLWTRLYSECMNQQPEANTVSEIFQHRAQCGRFASESVGKTRDSDRP